MDTIDGMKAMVAVARYQSFTEAGKHLELSTKLVSKYIRQLETKLGTQLFNRTTRSVTLTEAGQSYFVRCQVILEQLEELNDVVQQAQQTLSGTINITAPTGFGSTHLVNALAQFQQRHDKVKVNLLLSDQRVAIVEQGIDLAIRIGELTDSSLRARNLSKMRVVVVGSEKYFDRCGRPKRPEDLAQHNCLIMSNSLDPSHWQFLVDNKPITVTVNGSFRANSPKAITQMAAQGLGIGLCPIYAVNEYLSNSELEILFADCEANTLPISAVYPNSKHLPARTRALIDHLADAFNNKF